MPPFLPQRKLPDLGPLKEISFLKPEGRGDECYSPILLRSTNGLLDGDSGRGGGVRMTNEKCQGFLSVDSDAARGEGTERERA